MADTIGSTPVKGWHIKKGVNVMKRVYEIRINVIDALYELGMRLVDLMEARRETVRRKWAEA